MPSDARPRDGHIHDLRESVAYWKSMYDAFEARVRELEDDLYVAREWWGIDGGGRRVERAEARAETLAGLLGQVADADDCLPRFTKTFRARIDAALAGREEVGPA